jgi:hypothetical protein
MEAAMDAAEVHRLLDMLDGPPYPQEISEEDWNSLTDILSLMLSYAAAFYDNHESRIYDFALGVAWHVLQEKPPEEVLHCMAGLAYFMLKLEDLNGRYSRSPGAHQDTHPEFAEMAGL